MSPQPAPRQPPHDEIVRAARILRDGGIVAFPTETVYGLGAHALDAEAVARIYALKGRPATSPLIVHAADLATARALAADWPEAAHKLAAAFWPGPLTMIVPKSDAIPPCVTAGLPTVGLRVPGHPVAQALLREANIPVAAPSANPFTRLSATRAEHVRAAFPTGIDMVLDGGASPVGIESTVVTLVGQQPRLLRHGAISLAQLQAVLGPVAQPPAFVAGAAQPSPGMHARHYSPRTRLTILPPGSTTPPGRGVRVRRSPAKAAAPGDDSEGTVLLPADARGFAARLYDTLHELDGRGLDWIAVDAPPDTPDWDAVRDRLRRAAT